MMKNKNTCPLDHSSYFNFIQCDCNYGERHEIWDFKEQQLEEKQKIIDEQLEIIKALSKIKYYEACGGLMVQDRTQPVPLIKKAREYLQRMESKK